MAVGLQSRARVLTLVFTDLVGSTALKTARGDRVAGDLIAQHRAAVLRLAAESGGRIVDWAGDGCFLSFEASSAAVLFSLRLQQVHAAEAELPQVRIGVNLGEVTEKMGGAAAALRLEGLAVDLAARIGALARPGQILLSSAVFDSVRQRLRGEELGAAIEWRAHGAYEFKGVDGSVLICEAGLEGISPLSPPEGSDKAHRAVTPGEEDTLGWRPAVGLKVRRRDNWIIEQQLGEGGFGEVWLAVHTKTKAKRVFKFCFEPERLRGLRREVVLFRLLKETLGNRDDIAQLVDWDFDQSPYFLESEYTEGGDLRAWAESRGGLDKIPIETRIELVAQVAVALGAAHSVGVLHKDIKPANILITEVTEQGRPRARLTDFGIGLIVDPGALAAQGITAAGLTLLPSESSTSETGAGTRLYIAPELLEGKPATTLSDIYALGVTLYQMVIGDLSHAVGSGWERDVADEILREDIAACLDGDPARRIRSANELAERLRSLPARRAQRAAQQEMARQAGQALRRRRQWSVAGAVVLAVAAAAGVIAWQALRRAESERRLNVEAQMLTVEAQTARAAAVKQLYYAQIQLAASQYSQNRLAGAVVALENSPAAHRQWEWGYLVRLAFADQFAPQAAAAAPDASSSSSAELWGRSRGRHAASWREHATEINMVHVAPDGRLAFSASDDGTMRSWDLATGKSIHKFGEGSDALFCADYDPKSGRVAAAGFDGVLYVWDAGEAAIMHRLDVPTSSMISDILIDAAGGIVYTACTGIIGRFDLGRGAFLDPFDSDGATVTDLRLDTAQGRLVAASLDGRVLSWNLASGEAGPVVSAGELGIQTSAVLSPGLDVVLTSLQDGNAVLWDARTGERKARLAGDVPPITHVATFSPDGSAVAVPDRKNGVALYDASSGKSLVRLELPDDGIRSVAFHPDGRRLLVGGVTGTLRVWEPVPAEAVSDPDVFTGHSDLIYFASFSPDGSQIASASFDGTVRVWDTDTGRERAVLKVSAAEALQAAFSQDGRYLRTQGTDHTVQIWDTRNFELLHTLVADPSGRRRIAPERIRGVDMRGGAAMLGAMLHPFENKVSVNESESVGIYDIATGKKIVHMMDEGFSAGFQVFSRDGRTMVSTSSGRDVWAFDVESGAVLHRFKGHTGPITLPSISPEGRFAVTGSFDKTVRVWDLREGGEYRKLEGHEAFLVTARFDPTGTRVLSSSGDGTARIWDVESGKEIARLAGHGGMVINADYSPGGERILTYSWDNTAKVWDTDGRELVTIPMETAIVHGSWSPDGRTIALCSADGRLRLVRSLPWEEIGEQSADEGWLEEAIAPWVRRKN